MEKSKYTGMFCSKQSTYQIRQSPTQSLPQKELPWSSRTRSFT